MSASSGLRAVENTTANILDDVNEKCIQSDSKVNQEPTPEKQDAADEKEDDLDDGVHVNYPSAPALALLTIGLCLVVFIIALDNTVIATAIPKITTIFNSLDDVGWYGSSYLLATTSLQPSFGKVYTYFDVKWTFLSSLVLFEVGSIICAAATSSPMLIVGRAVAGAGASALFSGGMTIIAFSVPIQRRPMYLAIVSSMFGIASIVGPILGGVFTDRVSWRWCFWINLPFGACAFIAVLLFFKPPERDLGRLTIVEKVKKIDILGAIFLICAIVCLLLALQWGGTIHPWKSSRVWGLLLGFGLLIITFIVIQIRRGDDATIPPRLFTRQRTVLTASLFSCLFNMGLFTHIYYLPFYFQAVKGTTAEQSGIRSIPYLVSNTVSALVVGGIITKIGYYVPFLWIGASLFTVGSGLLFTLRVDTAAGRWIGYQILAGFGAGPGIQVPFLAMQAVLKQKEVPIGNAIIMFFNSLGGAISISIAQNVFSNSLLQQVPKHTTGVDPALIIGTGATSLRHIVPPNQLQGVLIAYANALDRAFILPIAVGGAAFVISLFVEWNTVKGKEIAHTDSV